MNKKGLTLVELIATLVVLAVIALIAIPNITGMLGTNKGKISDYEKKLIIDAAEAYMADYVNDGNVECEATSVTVNTLIDDGYLADSYKKYNETNVNITCEENDGNNKYSYELEE